MIKAVFFDLYNTLVRYDPTREQQQIDALKEYGLETDTRTMCTALHIADIFFYQENARSAVHKRPDYEHPYKAAIDLLVTLPGVDERLAMTGYSFGGYVTCRVAAHEQRLQAIAPNSPIIDTYASAIAFAGPILETVQKLPAFAVNLIGKLAVKKLSKTPVVLGFKQYTDWASGMYPTEMDAMEKLQHAIEFLEPFTVKDRLGDIHAAAIGLVSDGDGAILIQQAEEFIAGISSPVKKLHRFTMEKDGSDDHCQLDNRARGAQVMFDFFDEVFDYRYVPDGV